MSRLGPMFEDLKEKRAALIAYETGFFPDLETSESVGLAMLDAGADVLEIGIPFSDPVMDGPVIQASSHAALEAGATPAGVLGMVSRLRRKTDKPLLAMTYYNLVYRYGLERFAADATAAGLDALVVPDLPAEEMDPLREACIPAGLDTVAFVSPTTEPSRIEEASAAASGFLYCVALLGPTGERDSVSNELPGFLERVREHSDLPLAVGLGISSARQCAEVGRLADGVIVGSALVRMLAEGRDPESLVAEMASALGGQT
ncbi:MAG: tryptophan synthase subunit alpha [Actinobacteria bacterium]|nr:tryptophan synthase subunit alpha [Actinomycetota bacterium]MBU2688802.1 tryptophan synthase subunit alpha [Actinomycetota bacterium]